MIAPVPSATGLVHLLFVLLLCLTLFCFSLRPYHTASLYSQPTSSSSPPLPPLPILPPSVHGDLEFVNTDDMKIMNKQEHVNCTAITWDPTGRFCTTIVSIVRVPMDTGYIVWTFQGVPLQKHLIDRFFSLQWRPRPPSLLEKADIKDIQKNWKEYSSRFEAADKMMQSKASRELIEKRRALRVRWPWGSEVATEDGPRSPPATEDMARAHRSLSPPAPRLFCVAECLGGVSRAETAPHCRSQRQAQGHASSYVGELAVVQGVLCFFPTFSPSPPFSPHFPFSLLTRVELEEQSEEVEVEVEELVSQQEEIVA